MKSKKVLILAIIFTLLTSNFAMSDDGANEPVIVKEKEEVTTNVNSVQTERNNQTESKETVREVVLKAMNGKLIYGKDTGLTKQEYDQLKKDYFHRIDELGWFPGSNYSAIEYTKDEYFMAKINLDAADELVELGWQVGKATSVHDDILLNEVILLGNTTDSMSYNVDKTGVDNGSVYEFKVDRILKGTDIMHEGDGEGSLIYLESGLGKKSWNSAEKLYFKNTKYILFIKNFMSMPKESPFRLYHKGFNNCLIIDGENVYKEGNHNFYKKNPDKHKLSYTSTEVIKLIEDIVKINDSGNFFRRKYLNNGGK